MVVEAVIPAVKGGADSFIQGLFTPILTLKRKKTRHTKKRDITTESQLNINGLDIAIGGAVLTAAMLFGVVGWKTHKWMERKTIVRNGQVTTILIPHETTLPCAGNSGTFGGWNGQLNAGNPAKIAQYGVAASGGLAGLLMLLFQGGGQ